MRVRHQSWTGGFISTLARRPQRRAAVFAYRPTTSIWCSDGTSEGTTGIATHAVSPTALTVSGSLLYFSAREEFPRSEVHPGRDLWRSDGTSSGTFRLGILHGDVRGGPSYRLVNFNGTLLFSVTVAGESSYGERFGRSDGTPEGTFVIFSRGASSLTATPDAAYFAVCDDQNGCEPWVSDVP
jgi:ELWxxDGT repeat protein